MENGGPLLVASELRGSGTRSRERDNLWNGSRAWVWPSWKWEWRWLRSAEVNVKFMILSKSSIQTRIFFSSTKCECPAQSGNVGVAPAFRRQSWPHDGVSFRPRDSFFLGNGNASLLQRPVQRLQRKDFRLRPVRAFQNVRRLTCRTRFDIFFIEIARVREMEVSQFLRTLAISAHRQQWRFRQNLNGQRR